jgi:uncharacterized membrane protein HdeD (DUF308 family)
MANALASRVQTATTWSIVVSILMIAAGFLAIALPQVAGLAIAGVVAWLLMFSGVLHLMLAWRSGTAGGVIWEILLGVVYGAIGLYLLAHPVAGLASLTLVLAVYLVVEGALEIGAWVHLRSSHGSVWLLFDGVVTLILAAMIWSTWPSSTAWVIGTLLGISMLFSGISRLMLSLSLRRLMA